ncbi:MAG: hypothetical protein WC584_00345 [Candidatus Pacearchaeota archaeon]
MGKGLAITGFILSLISLIISSILFFAALSINSNWGFIGLSFMESSFILVIVLINLLLAIIGFIINLIVLIKKLEGKSFAIVGIIFNLLMVMSNLIPPIAN